MAVVSALKAIKIAGLEQTKDCSCKGSRSRRGVYSLGLYLMCLTAALSLPVDDIAWPMAGEVGGWWDAVLHKGRSMVPLASRPSARDVQGGRAGELLTKRH